MRGMIGNDVHVHYINRIFFFFSEKKKEKEEEDSMETSTYDMTDIIHAMIC